MAIRWLTIVQRLRGANVALALCLVVLSPRVGSAQPPPEVINRATVEFFHAASGQTNQLQSEPVRTVVAPQTNFPPPEIHFYQDNTYAATIQVTTVGQPLFVQALAPGCNLNATLAETNAITILSEKTGDRESYLAVETEPNSGRFAIVPNVPTRSGTAFPVVSGNGIVETEKNDILTAEMTGCGTNRTAVSVLVDPGGVVFDSRSNVPVPGARVLLVDMSSGLPAAVYLPDGSTPAPNPVTTGADGIYVFPRIFPGTYSVQVQPPPGYTAPSQVPVNQLPQGRVAGYPGSYGGAFVVPVTDVALQLDIPVDAQADNGSGLFVQKTVSRATAAIGDLIEYSVRVKNVSGAALNDVRVLDLLPLGFAYQKGSAQLDAKAAPNPAGGAGPQLEFLVGALADQATASITYRVRIGPGAANGNGENTAQAVSPGPPQRVSNLARVQVQLVDDVFTTRGYLVGKVFVDLNTNRVQDAGEPGVPGVRLYLEDGTYVITDSEGKYDLYGLKPITHVLKVDTTTLPRGARLLSTDTRNALSPSTRFVDIRLFEIQKANFAIAPGTPAMMVEIMERRQAAGSAARELDSGVKTALTRDGAPVPLGDLRNRPASGVIGGTPSQVQSSKLKAQGTETNGQSRAGVPPALPPQDTTTNIQTSDVVPPATGAAGTAALPSNDWTWPPGLEGAATNRAGSTPNRYDPVLPPSTLNANNSDLPSFPSGPARVTLQQALTNLDNSLGFIGLNDGDTLAVAQATIWVKGVQGAKFILQVNGAEVPASRVSRRATLTEKQLEAWEFLGVGLRAGTNQLTLTQKDAFGNARGTATLRVIAPDKLGTIRIVLPKHDQPADGKTPAKITVLLEDAKGVPVTARTPLTLEASLGQWQVQDLNKNDPGVQVFIEGGRAEYPLLPPLEPGDAAIRVSSGAMLAETRLAFLPELRPFMAVGLVEGRINLNNLKAGAIVPTRSTDGFQEELQNWATRSDDGEFAASGRAAFFLKGKIKGEYLLTASYDSDKDTQERMFRDIQPDQFYPVYGDDAVKGFDAQSTGRFYVRIDKRRCYLLYGDYATATTSEARGLGNYSRSLTGLKYHYEKNSLMANVWAAQDSTRQVIQEVRGNGTSGPYFVGVQNGIVNSEKVEIITRDRHQPDVVLKAELQTRFTDYEFEPFTGRILFRQPVPSLDANLNPIFIRITYEADTGGDKHWTFGGDAQAKLTKRWEVGGSGVSSQDPLAPYQLSSANTTYKLGQKTYVLGEVARSDLAGVSGDGARAELRHQGDKFDARLYYGYTDNTFSNAASVLAPGRVEAGAKFSRKLAANTRLIGQAIDSESTANAGPVTGRRTGGTLGVEHTFTNQMKLEVGGRYSYETAAPASPGTTVPEGLTPNEVRSARIKFTTPVPQVKNASLYGEYENDLVETQNRMVAVGGEYQFRPKTRLYARHEFLDSIQSPYELNRFQERNTTVVGLDTEYMKNGQSFNEYRMRDAMTGREAEAAMGLRNQWPIADGIRANTTLERVNPVIGSEQNEATAVTGAIEYTRNPNWKGTARLELRDATANNSLLNTFGYARKISRDWTFLGRSIVYLVDSETPSGHDTVQARFQAGMAWRQTQTDRWNALLKYEFKIEDGVAFTSSMLDRKVNILSLHANYQPDAPWQISGHYAGKVAFEDLSGSRDVYSAHLLAFRVTYDITKRFDIGINSAVLYSPDPGSAQFALGPEIGFTVAKNLRIGLGYNFTGFRDRDLGAEDYTQQGVYLALRLKFDEESLGLGRKKE